ncbi:TonB-dependent receptor, partial [Acinetobacter baumannii]
NASNSRIENRKYNLNQYFIGGEYKVNNFINLKVDYGISERAPEVNELYSSNVHYSVMAQEEGDQNLKPEKSKSLELGMFLNWNNWVMQLVGYQMDFENYMYLSHSGVAVQNRLPLKYWKQTDTDVKGFEIDLIYDFNLAHIGNIKLGGLADFVKNKAVNPTDIRLANDGVYLPNMPTNRYGMFLEWRNDSWKGKISSIYYDEPRYLGKNVIQEVPLSGYNLLEFKIDKKLKIKNASFDIFLNGTNLLNEEARPQNSPLKYIAPLPGRAFQLGITMHI